MAVEFAISWPADAIDAIATREDVEGNRRRLSALAAALAKIDEIYIAEYTCPLLYESGVIYRNERGNVWRDIPNTLKAGNGDCEDLACWRVAELRHLGVDAIPWVSWRRVDGRFFYHVKVWRQTLDNHLPPVEIAGGRPVIVEGPAHFPGWLEDPSLVLGM